MYKRKKSLLLTLSRGNVNIYGLFGIRDRPSQIENITVLVRNGYCMLWTKDKSNFFQLGKKNTLQSLQRQKEGSDVQILVWPFTIWECVEDFKITLLLHTLIHICRKNAKKLYCLLSTRIHCAVRMLWKHYKYSKSWTHNVLQDWNLKVDVT